MTTLKRARNGINPNHTDVIVTAGADDPCMAGSTRTPDTKERLPFGPRTPTLADHLANELVIELYRLPGPITTELKLHVAARVANRGGWKGYRGGRQRLAGWAGVYVEWMTPGDGWHFEALEELDHLWPTWTDGTQRFADLLAVDDIADLDWTSPTATAEALLGTGRVDAVRVLAVTSPLRSRVFTAAGPVKGVALADSELGFSAVA